MKGSIAFVLALAVASVAQAAVISVDTVDPMHDSSLWSAYGGPYTLFADCTAQIGGLDPNDTESPAMGVYRWWPDGSTPENGVITYQAEAGKTFSSVEICFGWLGSAAVVFAYYDEANNYIGLNPTTDTYLGTTLSTWNVELFSYDLTGMNLDKFDIIFYGNNWYTPSISSVAMTVTPEPATLSLLGVGAAVCFVRKNKRK